MSTLPASLKGLKQLRRQNVFEINYTTTKLLRFKRNKAKVVNKVVGGLNSSSDVFPLLQGVIDAAHPVLPSQMGPGGFKVCRVDGRARYIVYSQKIFQ